MAEKSGWNNPLLIGMPPSRIVNDPFWMKRLADANEDIKRMETMPLGFMETHTHRLLRLKQLYKVVMVANTILSRNKVMELQPAGYTWSD